MKGSFPCKGTGKPFHTCVNGLCGAVVCCSCTTPCVPPGVNVKTTRSPVQRALQRALLVCARLGARVKNLGTTHARTGLRQNFSKSTHLQLCDGMDCSSDDGLLLSSTPGTVPGVAEGALDAHAAFGQPPLHSPEHRRMIRVYIDQPPGAPRKPKRQRVLPPPGTKNSARRLGFGDANVELRLPDARRGAVAHLASTSCRPSP